MLDYQRVLVADIAQQTLNLAQALAFVSDDAHGGIALFVGQVRRQSHGRQVLGIEYDMFDALALNIFAQAAADAHSRFGPALKIYVAHARGALKLGDLAVVVAAGSPHRDEAFRACREVMEAVKHKAPIWKREHFVDGSTAWSEGCSLCYQGAATEVPSAAAATQATATPCDDPAH